MPQVGTTRRTVGTIGGILIPLIPTFRKRSSSYEQLSSPLLYSSQEMSKDLKRSRTDIKY